MVTKARPRFRSSAIRLEPIAAKDFPLLVRFARDFYAEDGRAFPARGRRALAALTRGTPHGAGYMICLPDGLPVGYVVISYGFSVEFGGPDSFLDDLYIAPAHRNRGLGSRVLQRLRSVLHGHGVRAMHLQVMPGNNRASRFYARHGFVASKLKFMSRVF
ncbi:MAG: GNAT family N-acetyltransferase [Alphaproteobacteria bacterium]|nr:GNAT family N-acetyltransferase [Alphaproteobacteria bacterium]